MRLNELVTILSGYAFDSNLFNETGVGIPIIRIRDVGKNKVSTFYSGDFNKNYIIQKGDFLIGMDGDFRLAKWKCQDALLNQRVCKIEVKNTKLNPDYLYYFLPKELKLIEDSTSFATVKHLSVKKIQEIQIPLPPLEQQKKIAAILDAADAYRQKTKALIAKYDELTQSLFLDMFGDPVKNNLNLPFPKIRGLTNVSQGMQIAIKERHKENGPNRYKYLTVAYLNGRKDEEFIESPRASVICNKDEILMIRTGNTGQVVTNVEGVFHNNFFKIDWDKKRLNKKYLVYFLSNPGIRRDLLKKASTTTIPDLSHSQFYDINIILPPIEMQNQFAECVQVVEVQKVQAQASLEKAEDLFKSLLQRAFKGELV